MEFITNLYESDYFLIGLFSLIAVLAFIFIVLAIVSGKKNKEGTEEVKPEPANTDAFQEVPVAPVEATVTPEPAPEVVTPPAEPITQSAPLNVEPVAEPIVEPILENNAFEPIQIGEITPEEVVEVEKIPPNLFGPIEVEDFDPEATLAEIKAEPILPKEEITTPEGPFEPVIDIPTPKVDPSTEQFSSVFIEPTIEPEIPELPKEIELPKIATPQEEKSEDKKDNDITPDNVFSIEPETYKID